MAAWGKEGHPPIAQTWERDPEILSSSHSPEESSSPDCLGQDLRVIQNPVLRLGLRPGPWGFPGTEAQVEVKCSYEAPRPALSGASLVTKTLRHLGFKQTISQGTELGTGENPLDLVREQFVGFIFGVGEQGAEVRG